VGSNPTGIWIFACCECCVLSGRGLCDKLITRPEKSYRLCCVVVCDLETSRIGASYIYDISNLRVNVTPHRTQVGSVSGLNREGTVLRRGKSCVSVCSHTTLLDQCHEA
jgi:hypothetical protein